MFEIFVTFGWVLCLDSTHAAVGVWHMGDERRCKWMHVAHARNIPNWGVTSEPSMANDGSNDHAEAVPCEVKHGNSPRFEHFEHGVVLL